MINFLLALLFGALVGWIANKLMGKSEGLVMTVILGLVGSFVGNTLYVLVTTQKLDAVFNSAFNLGNIVVAVVGALVASFVYAKLKK